MVVTDTYNSRAAAVADCVLATIRKAAASVVVNRDKLFAVIVAPIRAAKCRGFARLQIPARTRNHNAIL